jgi:hypothetical protein
MGLILRSPKLESDGGAREILNEFIENVGLIVQAKLDRFRQKLESVKHGSDKFKHITMPLEQVQVIGNAAVRFLRSVYGLKEDDIEITVLRRRDGGDWIYVYQFQDWSHGSTDWLSDRNSAANQCAAHGEPVFFADKIMAATRGQYVLSDRDKRRGMGSAYIYPIRFKTAESTTDFVISIVTYRIPFCPDVDATSREITVSFLREICRRFEIELCLDTIKSV